MPTIPPPSEPFVPLTPLGALVDAYRYGVSLALFAADERFGFQVDVAPDSGGSPNTGSITSFLIPGTTRVWEYAAPNDGAQRWFRLRHVRDGYDPSNPTPWVSATPRQLPGTEPPPTEPVGPVVAQSNTQDATYGYTTLTITDPQDRVTMVEFQTTVSGTAGAWVVTSYPYTAQVAVGSTTAPNLIGWRVTGYNAQGQLGYIGAGSNAFGSAPGASPQADPPVATIVDSGDATPRQYSTLAIGYSTQGPVAPGTMQYRYRIDNGDGTASPVWGAWTNFSGATASVRVFRAKLYSKYLHAQVQDTGSGLVSAEVVYALMGYLQPIDDSTGEILRSVPFTDSSYAFQSYNSSGTQMQTSAMDYNSRSVTGMFYKSGDTADNITDGAAFPLTGGRRGYAALDSSNVVVGGSIDFSRGYTGKHLGNIPDDATSNRQAVTLNQRTGAGYGYGGFTNLTGGLVSTGADSAGRPVTGMFSKTTDTADNITDGAAYPIAGGRLGYSSLDSTGVLASKVVRGRTVSDGYYAGRVGTSDGLRVDTSTMYDQGSGAYISSGFFRTVHTADNITDGAASPLAGGRRGYQALNAQYGLTTNVEVGATIGGYAGGAGGTTAGAIARSAGSAGGTVFSETFETDPYYAWTGGALGQWRQNDTSYSSKGRGTWNISGAYYNVNCTHFVNYDPNKLYRIRFRILCYADGGTVANQILYLGIQSRKADGSWSHTNGNGNQYVGIGGVVQQASQGWVTYTGWFKGNTGAVGSSGSSTDPTAPVSISPGTVQISPLMLINYSTGTANFVIDFIDICEFDEDASYRTYRTASSAGNLYRGRVFDDGNYAVQANATTSLAVNPSVYDSRGAYVNVLFSKAQDTADNITDGASSPLAGGARAFYGFNSASRIADESHLPMVRVNSGGATPFYGTGNTTNCISSVTWTGSTYTANVPAWTMYAGSRTVSYNSGSVAGLGQNLTYYIYCDDPNFAGGAVTYYASTTLYSPTASDGRSYVGAVTTGSGGSSSATYAGGSAACFEGDTPVRMADWTEKPISAIRPGDQVLSFDPVTGALRPGRVTATEAHTADVAVTVSAYGRQVVTTPEHPFFTPLGDFTTAGCLTGGASVMTLQEAGRLEPQRVREPLRERRRLRVYNFTVERWHTYLAAGFAVHNVKLQ